MSSIITILREVRDPRDMNARHILAEVLFVALAATLCGAKNCVDMADFADARLADLREIVPLRHGAPSHDTFSRIFRLLDPEELARAFAAFMGELRRELGLSPPKGVVAIDAKALRRGYEKGQAHLPPLMVSVWDSETRLAIASSRAPGGAEVKATLDLLKGLTLKGCTVTADALHCHPAMAEAVLAAKAHYALGLKGNHGPLLAAAEAAFAKAGEPDFFETQECRHGRNERRRAAVLPVSHLPFPGLKAIGRLTAERIDGSGRTLSSVRHVALSKRLSPQKLAAVVRAHWSIENQLHWTLDVVFDEDDARTRKDNAPQNLAVIRRLALNILRAHPLNASIASKMRRARWSKEFLFELFAHMR
jgi:predicted transposase YbfD/YdcC